MNQELSPETLAAQAMGDVDATSGALTPAIHPSTTYERSPDGTYRSGLVYTRADNPTYDHAERLLATLEGGAAGMLFASGSAAATEAKRSEEHTSELQSLAYLVCRLLLEKKKKK